MKISDTPIYAAGVVCWLQRDGEYHVLLIHRPRYDDVSFPKGKLDPDEALPTTAVRELFEETGLAVHLGAPFWVSEYALPDGHQKQVWYWTAELDEGHLQAIDEFVPNEEVDELLLVPVSEAFERLTYEPDQDLLHRFVNIGDLVTDTFSIVLQRHGQAAPASHSHSYRDIELTKTGESDARYVSNIIQTFPITRVYSSPATRCVQTAEITAEAIGLDVKISSVLSQDFDSTVLEDSAEFVSNIFHGQHGVLLCSHSPIIPVVLREIGQQLDQDLVGLFGFEANLATSSAIVLHLSKSEQPKLVSAEKYLPNATNSSLPFGLSNT